jgi:hypothetical protein
LTTPRQQSATEQALRALYPDPESQARADLIFGEVARAVQAQDAADREDIRRAAAGRRLLVGSSR